MDLGRAIPGLIVASAPGSLGAYIRGIGNRNGQPGAESATAVYVDGQYIASYTSGNMSLNNIDHIEVLKGAQGVLYGRNATAGVIQIVTKTPQQETSGEILVDYANYDTFKANFYGTTGITDNLAADLAIYYRDMGEGYGTVYSNREMILNGSI